MFGVAWTYQKSVSLSSVPPNPERDLAAIAEYRNPILQNDDTEEKRFPGTSRERRRWTSELV